MTVKTGQTVSLHGVYLGIDDYKQIEHYKGKDPLNKWGGGYVALYEGTVNWILKNVFNCSEEDIILLNQNWEAQNSPYKYHVNGYYYMAPSARGRMEYFELASEKPNGEFIEVIYYIKSAYDDTINDTRYALVSQKEYEGVKYWSLYYECRAS